MSEWIPRGGIVPTTIEEWYEIACSPIYADSGIQKHLEYFKYMARGLGDIHSSRIVELGIGGGDQSTVAWLYGQPKSLACVDVNEPGSLPLLREMAYDNAIDFEFIQGSTADVEPIESDILFIDTLHTADTVAIELKRFAPLCTTRIIFHDVISFGVHGQCDCPDQGINLAIAEFLFTNPEWQIERYSEADNGLLTLVKTH